MLISLQEACKIIGKNYPIEAMIMRIDLQNQVFFVIDFPENKGGSSFSGIVYKVDDLEKFISQSTKKNGLIYLLIEIMSLDSISHDYIDSKQGKMEIFVHREAKKSKNNWVWNGIKKFY